jgi:hypothetical protein
MKVKIKDNAATVYCSYFQEQEIPNREWVAILEKIQGKVLDVEKVFSEGQCDLIVEEDVSRLKCVHVSTDMFQQITIHKDKGLALEFNVTDKRTLLDLKRKSNPMIISVEKRLKANVPDCIIYYKKDFTYPPEKDLFWYRWGKSFLIAHQNLRLNPQK